MEKFIFTFNAGHPFVNYCQEVFAENEVQAKTRMTEKYGKVWKLGYAEAEFIELERKVRSLGLPLKKRLSPIYCRGVDKQ